MEQPATQDPLIGVTIGNYEVRYKLGVGGMGAVYMAEHPLIGKKVALKVLHSEFSSNEDVVSRFFHEAKAVNDIQHPNIVDILDYGVIPSQGPNTVYFIMEFLDGMSLAELIRKQAPLAPERALAIALQIADALGASHSKGIVHRDLKPDNIMLIQRGREADFVKVLDFGIAKLTGEQKGSMRTRTGIVMGTPAYMSPEQCEGRGSVDHRTDIYALGILLYEMLTGQVPFTGEGYGEILVKHLTQPPPAPSTIRGVLPPHVEAVVLKALEKSPGARYATMDAFMSALTDPVGYVEAHGGISAFIGTALHSVVMPVGGSVMSAPNPLATLTPAPGQVALPMSDAQSGPAAGGRRIAIIGTVAALFLALAAGGYVMMERAAAKAGGAASPQDARVATQVVVGSAEDGSDASAGQPGGNGDTPGENAVSSKNAGTGADTSGDRQETSAAAARSEDVAIKIISHPDGAAVFVGEEKEPRGKTPLVFHLPRGSDTVAVTIERDGYENITRAFKPTNNKEFDLQLRRDRRGNRPKGNRVRPQSNGNRTTDQNSNKNDKIKNDVMLEEPDWD